MGAIIMLLAVQVSAGEMDLLLRGVTRQARAAAGMQASQAKGCVRDGERLLVPCLLRSRDIAETAAAIRACGGKAHEVVPGILAARIPPEAVEGIAGREEVAIAEAAPVLSRKMDSARTATEVDVVQSGTALGIPYLGTNVVVGVVDSTLDYGHPDFLGSKGITRIQYLEQTLAGATLACTKRTVDNGSCSITDLGQGLIHGTHVTGIAAGANSVFTGVAPSADIMFIFSDPADADTEGAFATAVLEGVSTIFEKADLLDKPAVVNLSLGTSIGAHDGTSLLEEGLSALTSMRPGRIVVGAAGNEQAVPARFASSVRDHIGGIHASIAAAAGESAGPRLMILNGTGATAAFTGGTFVDVWLDVGQKDACAIAAFAYTGGRSTPDFSFPGALSVADAALSTGDVSFAADTPAPVTAEGASTKASIDVSAADPRNGKPHATVVFSPTSGMGAVLQDAWLDVVIRSNGTGPCTGNMWLYMDYTPYHDFLTGVSGTAIAGAGAVAGYALSDGDSLMTMTIPATASGVIAAGSFMPPKPAGAATSDWTADNGNTYDQSDIDAPGGMGSVTNDLSSFSSLGPTADGRTKPEIVAPGEPIVATKARGVTVSSSLTVGGEHYKGAGTSMAAPHVAGIVALLLERNNTLSLDAVRTALAVGAHTDGMTAKTPDPVNSFGAGKIDAAAVLASVVPDTSAYHGTGDLEPPDARGCALLPGAAAAPAAAAGAACLCASALIAWARHRRKRGGR